MILYYVGARVLENYNKKITAIFFGIRKLEVIF